MPNQWEKTKELSDIELDQVAKQLGTNSFYAQLLANRNINSPEQAHAFFNPSVNDLHDPFLMKNMQEAVQRIDLAVQNNERIWVYGDYDVDGTTSVALMFSFLRQYSTNIDFYIPDREKEGYGLSALAVDLAAEQEVNLVITLDCGIRSVDLVAKAKENNIDFIICDHHEVGSQVPDAVAVLDAKQPDCAYPYKELSACAVGFKLIQALCQYWNDPEEIAFDYLDYVAVSIASDLVPITGENRTLAFLGLKKLEQNPSTGLRIIMEKFMSNREIDITNIIFMIGPRINAAGRLASARTAVNLLLAESEVDGDDLAKQLDQYNMQRREMDATITEAALDQLATDASYRSKKTTVVYSPNWHKGVIGIVASRIMETYYKPTIVLTQSKGKLVGSARSIESFDIHDALNNCAEFLEQFGGHKFAAGLTLLPENLVAFQDKFEEQASHLTSSQLTRKILYEAEISLVSITENLYTNIKRFAPFGPENMKPVFLAKNVFDTGSLRTMGSGYKHLKLNLVDSSTQSAIGATAFGFGHLYNELKSGNKFDVLFTIEENTFRGRTTIELMVKDIRIHSN